jgi:uncharacterized protein (TIGR03083 family)
MRLDWDRYLGHIRADGERLAAAAEGHLDRPAPWCPGWVGRDVVQHIGIVHRHKLAIVAGNLQENPEPETAPAEDDALGAWYREGLEALLAALTAADPAARVFTWHRADRSVGFWIRRMAHETAIHRADAESITGDITPLDPALAADGVDEVLGPIMCAYTEDPHWGFEADGRTAELRMPDTGDTRHLVFGLGTHGPGWLYAEGPADDPLTVIEAAASDLDLWAWGRAGEAVLTVTGESAIAEAIRALAAEATG